MTATSRAGVGRALRAAFTERLPLKIAALFFAIVLWLMVSAEEPTEEIVAVRFTPSLDSGVVVAGAMPEVHALVLGSGRELLKLYNAPPVIVRRISATPPDSVRLELAPNDVDLPAGVKAVVRDVRPRVVTLRLARAAATTPATVGLEPTRQ